MTKKPFPDLSFEKQLWKKGYVIIGIDEVGRGCLAGPLVVGAVCFKSNLSRDEQTYLETLGINDSKKLSAQKRETLSHIIKKEVLIYSIARVPVSVINNVGITNATKIAIRKAVGNIRRHLTTASDRRLQLNGQERKLFVLADAFYTKYIRGVGLKQQKAIIHGDELSLSIAAASIIAKVYRDSYMTQLSKQFPLYQLDKNKGYGTEDHRRAIATHGTTIIHRDQFVRNI